MEHCSNVYKTDVFGIVKPSVDAHTLGIDYITRLLRECCLKVLVADAEISDAACYSSREQHSQLFFKWLKDNSINRLCFSYRLDPDDGVNAFNYLIYLVKKHRFFSFQGGPIIKIYFAGLPSACTKIEELYPGLVLVFRNRESDMSVLTRMGIAEDFIPGNVISEHTYDKELINFGRTIIKEEKYKDIKPSFKGGYNYYGTDKDCLISRLENYKRKRILPLIRSHAGPYYDSRKEAVKEFIRWVEELRDSGFIDVLSIGTSQLSQSNFGEDWGDTPNGGGVPINSVEEYNTIYETAKPMLVRTYAGTKDIPQLARMYEKTINMAWHALSLWWFCQIDGRGEYELIENLRQHYDTIKYISSIEKPFEPNIPHQFAFRGSDDITYVLSAFIAAKLAKRLGIKFLIIQNMLNTPRQTWGVQDIAKARAMLFLIRTLSDKNFHIFYQPRAGLDYFSSNLDEAKVQLAAVTALMDDVEPFNNDSPHMIHVVSYTEGSHMAKPDTIIDSTKITLYALQQYRVCRNNGYILHKANEQEVNERVEEIISGVKTIIKSIENNIHEPYSPEGLYLIFAAGYLPTPWLWRKKTEFKNAIRWETKLINGSIKLINEEGDILKPEKLSFYAENNLRKMNNEIRRE